MNAYELADELDYYEDDILVVCQAAIMLRQQADRISKLEDKLSFYELKDLDTHPVKQLSDEEIDKIENKVYLQTIAKGKPLGNYSKQLARAIIKEITE